MVADITEQKTAEAGAEIANGKLKRALIATIEALSNALEKRDPYTAGHQKRVAELAVAIGRKMGLDDTMLRGLEVGGLIHDIGKIYVPAEILSRPGRLLEAEYAMIKTHCQVGHDIIKNVEMPWPVADMVLQHHERMDGSGYPQGLKGEAICLEARILGVADTIEAMASHRPYRPALGIDKAIQEIFDRRGSFYDSRAVDACIAVIREDGFSFTGRIF
jgi:putative nucleotidyltransferase with HDIG domain